MVGISLFLPSWSCVKDALLDKHLAENTFGDQQLQVMGRPMKSLLVAISWSCILVFGAVKFIIWSSLLSSWKGIAFSVAGLALVTILMYIFILFSQSERSTPARVAPLQPRNGNAPSEASQKKQH
ncbi:hypothetical protein NE237_008293 [Protea cynaroides]|uniref:Uncharacterized protein n=1 Tax=Protea cynaroides TaxID=273540 RepID=A0A9Q0JT50_9MAGN|nr:hypothetical protein NE237_008293 [Protea cynaroides]